MEERILKKYGKSKAKFVSREIKCFMILMMIHMLVIYYYMSYCNFCRKCVKIELPEVDCEARHFLLKEI